MASQTKCQDLSNNVGNSDKYQRSTHPTCPLPEPGQTLASQTKCQDLSDNVGNSDKYQRSTHPTCPLPELRPVLCCTRQLPRASVGGPLLAGHSLWQPGNRHCEQHAGQRSKFTPAGTQAWPTLKPVQRPVRKIQCYILFAARANSRGVLSRFPKLETVKRPVRLIQYYILCSYSCLCS